MQASAFSCKFCKIFKNIFCTEHLLSLSFCHSRMSSNLKCSIFSSSSISLLSFFTAQKRKLSIRDFFGKCEQIHSFVSICSHLLKKSFMESFIFCTMLVKALLWFCLFCINFVSGIFYLVSISEWNVLLTFILTTAISPCQFKLINLTH